LFFYFLFSHFPPSSPPPSFSPSPSVVDCSKLHIPPGGLYQVIDTLETAREQEATKEVRQLFNYYDKILDIPHTEDGIPLCALPESQGKLNSNILTNWNDQNGKNFHHFHLFNQNLRSFEKFEFISNILSASNHPQIPNIIISTSSAKDITVSYIPTKNLSDLPDLSDLSDPSSSIPIAPTPIILARYPALPAIILTTELVLVQNPDTGVITMVILAGGIDGSFHVLSLTGLSHSLFPSEWSNNGQFTLPSYDDTQFGAQNKCNSIEFYKNIVEITQQNGFFLEHHTALRPHQRYLTRITPQYRNYSSLPFNFRTLTSSHDQTCAFIDLSLNFDSETPQINAEIVKTIEFKGKIEAICALPTPISYQDGFHPTCLYPKLVPVNNTTSQTRFENSSIKKLYKGQYLDSVEFITPPLPFVVKDGNRNTDLVLVSVRNDAYLHVLNFDTMTIVDNICVNINGDDHVSFTVLDIAFDSYYGLCYLATDAQTILIMDTITKQHIRRLYCTDNNDLATPLLRLIKVPSFGIQGDKNSVKSAVVDGENNQGLIKYPTYRNVVAVSTVNNAIKIYNQHTQQQIIEYQCHTKNVKGLVIIPTDFHADNITNPFGFVTTGFDKTFAVYF